MALRHASLPFAAAAGAGLAVLAASCPSLAQPSSDTRAAAAALFEDGRRLMSEGKYEVACPKLAESYRMDPGAGTLYQLSVCYEAIGRTATAWVGFRDVANMAFTAGQPDREKVARGKAAALEPKLMRLKITAQNVAAGAGIEVRRDGAVVSPALWGTAVPLDPGPHKVSATANGKEPWALTVQLDQPGNTVTVDVPPLLDAKPGAAPVAGVTPPPPPPDGAVAPQAPLAPPPPVEVASPRPWQLPLAVTATVLGVGGMAAGVAFGFVAKSKYDQTNQPGGGCDANGCTMAGLSGRSDAVGKGNLGTGLFVAGAVFGAGAIALWVTLPHAHAATTGATTPQLGLGPTGAALRGGF